MKIYTIGLVGNPNCGKTTLFNALTGAKQRVGNWPGVTVERKSGDYTHDGKKIEIVDLPGIYSLSGGSVDEEVARDYILSGDADVIVNILDASNLERNLYLTVQLLEMKRPVVLALNMMDIAKNRKIEIDSAILSRMTGCQVVPIVASRGEGIQTLKTILNDTAERKPVSQVTIPYPPEIVKAITELSPEMGSLVRGRKINPSWIALKLLEGDLVLTALSGPGILGKVTPFLDAIEKKYGDEPDILVADSRYHLIGKITKEAVRRKDQTGKTLSDRIDHYVLNRALGIPFFLMVMYLMFVVTIHIGGAFIDFFDLFAKAVFVDGFRSLLTFLGSPGWLSAILADGIGGGIQTLSTFIPPIGFMFLSLCLLEDSGYMARAAFVMDRFMRVIGLPGKAFVPMLVGFGCNVPAIMATRTLENQRDRILTVMMNPFMSCGARLPVYALFAAAFFPNGGQNMVFGLYLIGIAFAVLTGMVLKNTLLKGEITPFIMELPPYHLPTVKGVLLRAWDRLKTFIFRAGRIILPVVVVLSFLNTIGTDGAIGNEDSEKSVLSVIGKAITPVFHPMGMKDENWPAAVGIFTGIFAKEAVVGTLDSLYGQLDKNGEEAVSKSTFGTMVRLFDGKAGAFAYLLLVLLYIPCVAAIGAIYRETNIRWTVFACLWSAGVAYAAAVLFYQAANLTNSPMRSLTWMAVIVGVFGGVIFLMRHLGNKEHGAFMGTVARMTSAASCDGQCPGCSCNGHQGSYGGRG